jgi:hypothetical protein
VIWGEETTSALGFVQDEVTSLLITLITSWNLITTYDCPITVKVTLVITLTITLTIAGPAKPP